MTAAVSLLPLAVAFALFAMLTKFAARLYRSSYLSWKHAFAFGALAMLAAGAGALLNFGSGFALGSFLGFFLGLAVQLALGGWFLGPRAVAENGESVAFKGGVLIAAIAFGIIFAVGVLSAVLVPMLARSSQA